MERGYSLLEIMVVLFVIAIIALFAYPAYDGIMAKVEAQNVQHHAQEALRLAKVEALLQKSDVIVCYSPDGDICRKNAQEYIIVFVDKNRNNKLDKKDYLVSREYLGLSYGRIQMNVSLRRDFIKFMGDNAKPRGHFGHIKYCSFANDKYSYQVVINAHGIVSYKWGKYENIGCE
ncbi:GspH/FimT family pseudopilin [Moraxella nasovis]|uniref:GspH/FimT family pseudopilin n=1 Tax=Moraxella nasovis TaxID=2904121 RepID=UPI001F60471E|nr:GspH/FimT family pseudopilin [Moraxella nasovis]UNU72819.1 GspH/FimT family pseudopilin [Moraxella nasovis]